MKVIGRTNEGKCLVELDHSEYEALGNLINALGGGVGYDPTGRAWESPDLSNALATIHTYSRHLGLVNTLKTLTDELEKTLKGEGQDG